MSKPLVPFFAVKTQNRALVLKSGLKAGLGESKVKAGENAEK